MKYNSAKLSTLAYANAAGFTIWHYETQHSQHEVELAVGYFDYHNMKDGDLLIVSYKNAAGFAIRTSFYMLKVLNNPHRILLA